MTLINDKLILVIGGTGAQGQAVVKALVEPSSDGTPSPYTVRILTRNPDHPKVKAELNQPNLDYGLKKGGYRPEYHCGHYDGKGRIGDWLTTKPFTTSADGFKWTVFTNGPYAEMLYGGNFLPKILDDGTRVFAAPLGKGHVPIITLPDLGYFAHYIFDHPEETAGKNLEVASDYLA